MCGSSGRSVAAFLDAVRPILPLARVMPWIKPSSKNGAVGPFGWQTTLALMFGKNGGLPRAEDHVVVDNVDRRNHDRHPAQMPVAVSRWLAKGLGDPGLTVLDPFCGTGALVQGFLEKGCDVTGIDVSPRWAALARSRLASVENQHDLWTVTA